MTPYYYVITGTCKRCNNDIDFYTELETDLPEMGCTSRCRRCGNDKVRCRIRKDKTYASRNPLL